MSHLTTNNQTQLNNNQVISPLVIPRLYSIKDVQLIVGGKSRSTIYRWVANKTLPAPIRTGKNSIAWTEEDIIQWRESLTSSSTVCGFNCESERVGGLL